MMNAEYQAWMAALPSNLRSVDRSLDTVSASVRDLRTEISRQDFGQIANDIKTLCDDLINRQAGNSDLEDRLKAVIRYCTRPPLIRGCARHLASLSGCLQLQDDIEQRRTHLLEGSAIASNAPPGRQSAILEVLRSQLLDTVEVAAEFKRTGISSLSQLTDVIVREIDGADATASQILEMDPASFDDIAPEIRAISEAVKKLCFDSTQLARALSTKIDDVRESLNDLEHRVETVTAFAASLGRPQPDSAHLPDDDSLAALSRQYTMERERHVHNMTLKRLGAPRPHG